MKSSRPCPLHDPPRPCLPRLGTAPSPCGIPGPGRRHPGDGAGVGDPGLHRLLTPGARPEGLRGLGRGSACGDTGKGARPHTHARAVKGLGPPPDTVTWATTAAQKVHNPFPLRVGAPCPQRALLPVPCPAVRRSPRRPAHSPGPRARPAARPLTRWGAWSPLRTARPWSRRARPSQALAEAAVLIHFFRADPSSAHARRRRTAGASKRGLEAFGAGGAVEPGAPRPRPAGSAAPTERRPRRSAPPGLLPGPPPRGGSALLRGRWGPEARLRGGGVELREGNNLAAARRGREKGEVGGPAWGGLRLQKEQRVTSVARPGRPWNPTEPSCAQQRPSSEGLKVGPCPAAPGAGWQCTPPAPRPRKSETMGLEQELRFGAHESLPGLSAWR